jgi:hypothetical protein
MLLQLLVIVLLLRRLYKLRMLGRAVPVAPPPAPRMEAPEPVLALGGEASSGQPTPPCGNPGLGFQYAGVVALRSACQDIFVKFQREMKYTANWRAKA